MNDQLQTIGGNCITTTTDYGPLAGYMQKAPANFSVEPVEGGFIVTGNFPNVGYRRCVASTIPALMKLLRAWAAPPKKDA